ncbi:MAG TPA: alpha/beta hydrolase [Novosphingobium sp.]|nr:alpha/beta hydrolase [Novosphingobium sp.]
MSRPGATAFDRRAIPAEAVESHWIAADGLAIRRIDWPAPAQAPRGSLLFMGGRGDSYEKYLETLDYWHRQGWAVTAADWRGQGASGRLGLDGHTGHIDDFAIWVADLAGFWSDWQAATPGPHGVVAHSMGAHLVLRALAERRIDPAAAVLCAPMLGLAAGGLPAGVMHLIARIMCRFGDPRRAAWKWSDKPGQPPAERGALLTHDATRYADELWWREKRPEISLGPGSWGWLERSYASMRRLQAPGVLEKIATPILIIATANDRLVGFKAIARAAQRLPNGELLRLDDARHEILREADSLRDRALVAIDGFFAVKQGL